jgi:hypothetical protein
MGAFEGEDGGNRKRIYSLSTSLPLLSLVKPRDALLLIVVHALDTAGEHLDFWKTEIIDGSLMRAP